MPISVRTLLLWHVRHACFTDGRRIGIVATMGNWTGDESDGDDVKLLGVYSTAEAAQEQADRVLSLPSFGDEPDCLGSTRTPSVRTGKPTGL
ncbi:hypothetical protein C8E87_0558 [Paractinoplanes brasiliensis]|uniref:Uncharacterized protein n=1 Tax=Paractinoplanes brasiliensis TaxID=52695 RepID=A0A4R6JM94_9ACTN|nr:hypothetical protein C8E87_0558 [Actinoplanes brasiliensis]GID30489.1 hypothetical protein Abr02nite_54720 [Actinoplanes brasiliensis]